MNRARALALGVALAFGWHLALRVHGLNLPRMSDEGEYAYAARVWADGGLPYRDVFNQKPPATMLVYRACQAFSDSPVLPRAAAALSALLVALVLLALTPRDWSAAQRLAAPAAWLTLSTLPVGDFGFAANTEGFAVLPSALAVLCALRGRPALAGLLAGAAVMTKQTAVWPGLAALAVASWRGGRKWDGKAAGTFAASAAAIPAATFAYFAARGGAAEFWDCVVAGNMRYASVAGWGAAAEQGRFFARDLAPAFLKGSWPAWALAGYGLAGVQAKRENLGETAAVLWLAGGLLAAATGLLLFPHYFLQAAPPLALGAAYGVRRLGERAPAALAALVLVPALAHAGMYLNGDRTAVAKDLLWPSPLVEAEFLGGFMRTMPPGETIYVFGSEPQIYVYADHRAATRHDFVYPLTMFPKSAAPLEAELAALRAARPLGVVYVNQPISTLIGSPLGLAFRNEMRAWLEADYKLLGYVPVPREPAAAALHASAKPDWSAADRLYLFVRRP